MLGIGAATLTVSLRSALLGLTIGVLLVIGAVVLRLRTLAWSDARVWR